MIGEALRVPLNRAKLQLYRNLNVSTASAGLFLALLTLVGGLFMFEGVFKLMCFMLALFIGLATWPALHLARILKHTLVQNLPALVIDDKGLEDHSSNYVFGFIPWSEVENVVVTSRYAPKIRKTFSGIAFVVKNKEMLLRRQPGLMRVWVGMDQEITERRQVFIPQGRIGMPIEEVVRIANEWRNQTLATCD